MSPAQRQAAKRRSDRFRIALKRSWKNGEHHQRFHCGEVDVDTLRWRSYEDRRGTFYAEIVKRTEIGWTHFILRWSVSGRSDQVDIFDNGRIIATIRPNLALQTVDNLVSSESP